MTTLPVAPGAYGQPPRPPSDASKVRTPDVVGGQAVGQAEAARVVQVGRAGLVADRGAHLVEQTPHLRRVGHAGGVRQARLRRHPRGALGPASHTTSSSLTSPWSVQPKAVEMPASTFTPGASRRAGARWRALPRSSLRASCARWPSSARHSPTRGASACARRPAARVSAPRTLGTRAITVTPGCVSAWRTTSAASAICGSSFGRHEGADLDFAQAGRDQRVDPALLVFGGHGGLHGLQAVARADLADQDFGRGCLHGRGSDGKGAGWLNRSPPAPGGPCWSRQRCGWPGRRWLRSAPWPTSCPAAGVRSRSRRWPVR